MELWDIYGLNRQKTGKTVLKGEKLKDGEYRMVVHACIFNSHGEMLIQQRQPFKTGWSDLWDISIGGSAIAGETSQQAVERELREELGIDYDFSDIRPHLTVNFDTGFDDIYLIKKDISLFELKLQTEEVQSAKWASKNEILKLVDGGKFIPYHDNMIELLFAMNCSYGVFNLNHPTAIKEFSK